MHLDRKLPVELHAQIVQELGYHIATGALAPGARLPSAREAARQWQVNFHTVRKAYRELAKLGLVEILGPQGTRVANAGLRIDSPTGIDEFLDEIIARSCQDHGISSDDLILLLRNRGRAVASDGVLIVECNQRQADELARQVSREFQVDAVPGLLSSTARPTRRVVLGTLFHRAEMMKRWPKLRPKMRFLPIHPSDEFLETVRTTWLCERLAGVCLLERQLGVAKGMADDLSRRLERDERVAVTPALLTRTGRIPRRLLSQLVLVAPRVWNELPASQQQLLNVLCVSYQFDRLRLGAVGQSLGWQIRDIENASEVVCAH